MFRLFSRAEGSARERRFFVCRDSRRNRHKAPDKKCPSYGLLQQFKIGRGSTASPLLQLCCQELSPVRFSSLSQTQTACVLRPLAVKSPLPLTEQSLTNNCTSAF